MGLNRLNRDDRFSSARAHRRWRSSHMFSAVDSAHVFSRPSSTCTQHVFSAQDSARVRHTCLSARAQQMAQHVFFLALC
eukprot:g76213.t1